MEHHSFISTLIFSAINFLIYIVLMYRLILPKIKEGIERKEKELMIELEKARKELQDAEKRYEEAKRKRAEVDEKLKKIKEDMEKLAKTESERIINEAQKYASRKLQEVDEHVKMKVEEVRKELESYAMELAVKIAEEKIMRLKKKEDERKLLNMLIMKIDEMKARRN